MLRPRKCFHTLLEAKKKQKWREWGKRELLNMKHLIFSPRELHFYLSWGGENQCCGCCYLLRDAPRARITGSVISIMDCRVEVTTMKRMMLRRKVRCSACMSNRPVWRARRRSVTPSVTPLWTSGGKEFKVISGANFWGSIQRNLVIKLLICKRVNRANYLIN